MNWGKKGGKSHGQRSWFWWKTEAVIKMCGCDCLFMDLEATSVPECENVSLTQWKQDIEGLLLVVWVIKCLSLKQMMFIFVLFASFWRRWVLVAACRFPWVAESRGYSRVVVVWLLLAGASLIVDHGLHGAWASRVAALRLCCPEACGIFPDQGSNPCPMHWQADSSPLDQRWSLWMIFLNCPGWLWDAALPL